MRSIVRWAPCLIVLSVVAACTDRRPATSPQYTCEQQQSWGKCNEPWMVPSGNCLRSCGRCTAPSPKRSICTMREGWDLYGNDINQGCAANQRVASAAACCARCQATSGCQGFTYIKQRDAACPGGCWLKRIATPSMLMRNAITITGIPPGVPFPNTTSFGAPAQPPPPAPQLSVMSIGEPAPSANLTDGWATDTLTDSFGWTSGSMTWYGPEDELGSYNPLSSGLGNCLQNAPSTMKPALLDKYSKLYAAVNDHGPAFGYGACRPNRHAPLYPICDTQRNCGQCYELRCKQACLRNPDCNARCKAGSVTVLMGFNACRHAATTGTDHFDVAPLALTTIVEGESGEVMIEYRETTC